MLNQNEKVNKELVIKIKNLVIRFFLPEKEKQEKERRGEELQKQKYQLGNTYYDMIGSLVERVAAIKKPFMDAVQTLIDGFTQIEQDVYIENRIIREDELAEMEECLDVMYVLVRSLREKEAAE